MAIPKDKPAEEIKVSTNPALVLSSVVNWTDPNSLTHGQVMSRVATGV